MSTMQERKMDWSANETEADSVCPTCKKEVPYATVLLGGHCASCHRAVPVPLVFAYVGETPAEAAGAAAGEAALWLLNHDVRAERILTTLVNTTVGGPLEMFPFTYTLTLLVEVPRYMVDDLTTPCPTPVQTVGSVREMADTLSRPRTTPPTTYAPTVAHD